MSAPVVVAEKVNLELASGGSRLHILRDVTFSLAAGEVAAIVGPSGSGKTSLLMVLSGLERATSGAIVVDGIAISGLNEDRLAIFRRKSLGILFQNFHLIPSMTALENVALSLEIAERRPAFSRHPRSSGRGAGRGRPQRAAHPSAERAVGWRAAARRPCPRHGDPPAPAARRRTDRQPRPGNRRARHRADVHARPRSTAPRSC